jgi:ribonuclease HII
MKAITSRKWQALQPELAERVLQLLRARGGRPEPATNSFERWRVRLRGAVWIYYRTGTLFVTESDDPAALEIQREVDELLGGRYATPTRPWLVGCDEAGKGELFGPVVTAAVVLAAERFRELEELIGVADTKAGYAAAFWDELGRRLNAARGEGFDWEVGLIPPQDVDRFNLNRLLDAAYHRLLVLLGRRMDWAQTRLVLDDYRAGPTLKQLLDRLTARGLEAVCRVHADEQYLECRLAALVARLEQQRILRALAAHAGSVSGGRGLGSGNAGDPVTLQWLERWLNSGRPLPWFVRRSFRTVAERIGAASVKQADGPVNESLVAHEYLEAFRQGRLELEKLEVLCAGCGRFVQQIRLERREGFAVGVCAVCGQALPGLAQILRYLCGRVFAAGGGRRRVVSWLVEELGSEEPFFAGFTIVLDRQSLRALPAATRQRLERLAEQGRMGLEYRAAPVSQSSDDLHEIASRLAALPVVPEPVSSAAGVFVLEVRC